MNELTKPIITTIIPTYRRPQLLKRAIKSVLKQTYPHFQVCVYDNASGDDTASVVAEIMKADPRVKYYCHAENIGEARNHQYGLDHVETPFFSFLADDDFLLPEFYETALLGFESYPDAMFSATDVIRLMRGRLLRKTFLEEWTPGFYSPPDGFIAILKHGHSAWTGILYRKAVTEKVDLVEQGGCCGDFFFTLRIAARCPFVVSKRPGAVWDSSTSWKTMRPFYEIWIRRLNTAQNLMGDESLPIDVRSYAERVLIGKFEKELFLSGIFYLYNGRVDEAREVAILFRDQFHKRARYITLSEIINMHQSCPFARLFLNSLTSCYRCLWLQTMILFRKEYDHPSGSV